MPRHSPGRRISTTLAGVRPYPGPVGLVERDDGAPPRCRRSGLARGPVRVVSSSSRPSRAAERPPWSTSSSGPSLGRRRSCGAPATRCHASTARPAARRPRPARSRDSHPARGSGSGPRDLPAVLRRPARPPAHPRGRRPALGRPGHRRPVAVPAPPHRHDERDGRRHLAPRRDRPVAPAAHPARRRRRSPNAVTLDLQTPERAAVRTLVDDRPIDPDRLHALTGGNPFFVSQMLDHDGDDLPRTVRDAILARTVGPRGRRARPARPSGVRAGGDPRPAAPAARHRDRAAARRCTRRA